ncbi:nucleotide cyclase [Phlyctochytrium arcticum]|nr:nucleotide cyclase [Phlyctochytrium arcticum]KAI9093060.1 nucleotide cyclase [Phlyctochytrium arcticum]
MLTTENLLSIHNSKIGDSLVRLNNQPVQIDHVIPNFISKHTRDWCDRYLQRVGTVADKRSTPHLVPSAELTFAAVVMADVSGYSLLTSRLAELGPSGAEILGRTMKGYLDKIISTILSHGGDIVKFAGDAVIFYWPLDPRKDDIENEQTRGEIVLKASYCCLDLLHHCNPYPINLTDVGMKELRIHLGIGSGYVYDVHVGEQYRWEHFIAGDGVNQIAAVLDLAKPGQLAMSHQALRSLQVILELQSVTIGNYDKKCIILEGLEMARRKVSPPLIKSNDDLAMWDIVPPSANVELYRHFVNESALFKLQADVSQSRIFRMESGLNDLLSLTELRQITTVFIRIGSLRRWDSPALLGDAQEAMTIADRAVKRYEGDIRQFHVDEKGAVILAFFGLPPKAHENDATFGIKAALEICTRYLPLFDDFSVGITTGVVSIGGVGNSIRTEYAVMGDSINMAARLMCHAEAKRSLLCDERSYNLADTDFVFDKLGETMVKGKSHPIAIFRPRATLPERTLSKRGAGRRLGKGQLVGRLVEKDKIISELKQFEASGNAVVSSVLVFEAEGGQGLSTLLDYARVEAANYKLAMW